MGVTLVCTNFRAVTTLYPTKFCVITHKISFGASLSEPRIHEVQETVLYVYKLIYIYIYIQVYLMSQSWDNVVSMHDHLLTVHAHKT